MRQSSGHKNGADFCDQNCHGFLFPHSIYDSYICKAFDVVKPILNAGKLGTEGLVKMVKG